MNHTITLFFIAMLAAANAFTVSTPFTTSRLSKSTGLQMTILTYGAKKQDFKAGSPLKSACAKLGVKPKYSCKK